MPTPAVAANAYAELARIAQGAGSAVAGRAREEDATSFGALLKEALAGVAGAGHSADAKAQALAAGKANVVDVVTAVAEAETAVSALVAVRDSVIQSYQSVMSMAI
jgi:flagellar hook-basal body complex protein FliE